MPIISPIMNYAWLPTSDEGLKTLLLIRLVHTLKGSFLLYELRRCYVFKIQQTHLCPPSTAIIHYRLTRVPVES